MLAGEMLCSVQCSGVECAAAAAASIDCASLCVLARTVLCRRNANSDRVSPFVAKPLLADELYSALLR